MEAKRATRKMNMNSEEGDLADILHGDRLDMPEDL